MLDGNQDVENMWHAQRWKGLPQLWLDIHRKTTDYGELKRCWMGIKG